MRFLIDLLDETIALIPKAYQPETLIGMYIPGLGVLLSLLVLILTGIIATNFFGQRIVSWGEAILAKIPLVRSIYYAVKQIMQAVFSSNGKAFRKVMLIEYPRKGIWTIAFLTGTLKSPKNEELLSVFIPTTPNPTSGFMMLVAKEEATELSMTVDEALKFVISLGVVNIPLQANDLNNSYQADL
jgi:uncharacterized membrane protein